MQMASIQRTRSLPRRRRYWMAEKQFGVTWMMLPSQAMGIEPFLSPQTYDRASYERCVCASSLRSASSRRIWMGDCKLGAGSTMTTRVVWERESGRYRYGGGSSPDISCVIRRQTRLSLSCTLRPRRMRVSSPQQFIEHFMGNGRKLSWIEPCSAPN